jgi:hypothetical protein
MLRMSWQSRVQLCCAYILFYSQFIVGVKNGTQNKYRAEAGRNGGKRERSVVRCSLTPLTCPVPSPVPTLLGRPAAGEPLRLFDLPQLLHHFDPSGPGTNDFTSTTSFHRLGRKVCAVCTPTAPQCQSVAFTGYPMPIFLLTLLLHWYSTVT